MSQLSDKNSSDGNTELDSIPLKKMKASKEPDSSFVIPNEVDCPGSLEHISGVSCKDSLYLRLFKNYKWHSYS